MALSSGELVSPGLPPPLSPFHSSLCSLCPVSCPPAVPSSAVAAGHKQGSSVLSSAQG